ncbi:MAG: ribosome-associated translation inhibitor RaiA [Clostridium sp.]|nr:ribosome-associated translation inhibitor RaiA [Clostridium sp.]
MEINIESIHFDASDRLEAFITKKVERLARHNNILSTVDVTLRVVRPETIMNKQASIKVTKSSGGNIIACKFADTFEEAIDVCIDAIDHQLERHKDKE